MNETNFSVLPDSGNNSAGCNNVTKLHEEELMLMDNSHKIDYFVQEMINEGYYRYKPPRGSLVMYDGKDTWSYSEFAKSRQFIIGRKKNGLPEYFNLYNISMHRKDFPIIIKIIHNMFKPLGKVKDEPVINTAEQLKFPIEAVNNNEDVSIFWDHLDYLCGDVSVDVKIWVKDWLADIFQNPENKKGTALVFIGGQGCGKSIFFDNLLSALLGEYHFYNNEKGYANKFNLELRDRLLVNFDEGFASKSKLAEAKLKSFITQSNFKYEGKGTNGITVFNPARAVFTTNSMYAVNTADDDRRHAVFRTVKRDFITPEYFIKFAAAIENKNMLEKFMYELQNRKITSALNIPPVTEAKEDQKVFSADKITQWFEFIITTKRDYKMPLKDNYQQAYNYDGYLWAEYKADVRCMYGENGFKSFSGYQDGKNNNGIDSRNKLYTALKAYLENNKEWDLSCETKRITASQFIFDGNNIQRVWVFRRKT